ncbi:glycosyltransferase family 22 [Ilyonectria robusta]
MVVKGALSLLARPSPRKGGLCLRCLVATGVPVACTGIMMDRANRPTKAVMAAQISIGMQGIETWSGERQWHQQPRRARLTSTVRQGHCYPVRHTWEFTSENPIRSVFPLWPVYGLPMLLLRWLWIGNGKDGEIPPIAVFWTLRVLMFVISFVLEDWALHELIQSPRHRRVAVLLVASSYVTWTYQTHTFSNSVETLVVAWSLVLIQRLADARVRVPPQFWLSSTSQLIKPTHSNDHVSYPLLFLE